MLVLTRSRGDRIVIDDEIVVTILSLGRSRCTCEARHDGTRVQVGVEAPERVRVLRGEIYDSVRRANLASAGSADPARSARAIAGLVPPRQPGTPAPPTAPAPSTAPTSPVSSKPPT